jgi:hypothetical protein
VFMHFAIYVCMCVDTRCMLRFMQCCSHAAWRLADLNSALQVKVKVNLTLEQAMKAQRECRGIAVLTFNLLKPSGNFTYHQV